eukprot:CAMPEP_0180521398 /NCGR_PEP_ID=MMETSP1036_2-20121128/56793_1 /TAXON_ID=632150 /ORGANISM="Azadinium spinosum, Strain 3D9" /LENGTH=53 /DNA_ID=CAMNT_0022533987 /DNA_START=27 /DNA_END=185 /DNA_ORIENTATION=-
MTRAPASNTSPPLLAWVRGLVDAAAPRTVQFEGDHGLTLDTLGRIVAENGTDT